MEEGGQQQEVQGVPIGLTVGLGWLKFEMLHSPTLVARGSTTGELPKSMSNLSNQHNEAGAPRAWNQHYRKWRFWVRNLHPEIDIYGNVDITL